MAKLISDSFSVDIRFANYFSGIIDYYIQFEHGRSTLLNPLITDKKYFIVKEVRKDYLLSVLEEALEITLEEALEYLSEMPDPVSVGWMPNSVMSLIVAPCFELGFKYLRHPEKLSPTKQQRSKAIDELREIGGQFSGDTFVLEFCIGAEGLKNLTDETITFRGNAVGVVIMVRRTALKNFLSQLRKEYKSFCKKFKVNELGDCAQEFLEGKSKPEKMTDLEKKFDKEMRKIYLKAKKYGMNGDGLIGLIEEHGGVKAAKLLLHGSEEASGVMKLRLMQIFEREGLNLTVERLVLESQWESLFTPKELKLAQERFEKWK